MKLLRRLDTYKVQYVCVHCCMQGLIVNVTAMDFVRFHVYSMIAYEVLYVCMHAV